jgi:hypothetical protein
MKNLLFAIFFLIMAYGTESKGVSNFAMVLAIANLLLGTIQD